MRICVYGAASPSIAPLYVEKSEELGKLLAERGHSLVFGGGANGLMGAIARGVRLGKGHIIGVVPEFFLKENAELIDHQCDELIQTDTMRRRKQIMEEKADAFIVLPGGIGTFEEFFEILTLRQLCRHSKPIAVYNIDGYYNEIYGALEQAMKKGFLLENVRELSFFTSSPEELLSYLETPVESQGTLKTFKKG